MRTIHSKKNLLKRTAKLEKELATQKHELQIQAALEKVRVVAMGMNKPGDLPAICKTLYEQFLQLGFTEMRNAMVNIHNDEDKSFINYDYSKEIGKSSNHLTYNIHPLVEKQIKKIRSASDAFSETYFTGKDLTEWKKFRKRIGEKDDPRLKKNKGLYYYFYSIGTGSIGISTFGAISKEKKVLLKRFRNVFQLSYQRYIDISKAEAQARDAKIEAALEKIRSTSLAMHHPNELEKVVIILFEKLSELGLSFSGAGIFLFDHKEKKIEHWIKGLNVAPVKNILLYDEKFKKNVIVKDLWSAIEKGEHIFNKTYPKSVKDDFFQYTSKYNDSSKIPTAVKKFILQAKSFTLTCAAEGNSLIGLDSWSGPFTSEADLQILRRFARVFEQAYVRFLDLQKAEGQAREAKIEAALERVRASSMAMHRSNELDKVIKEVTEQLTVLGFDFDASNITTDLTSAGLYVWNASPEQPIPSGVYIPYKNIDLINWIYSDWGVHEGVKTDIFSKAQKNAFFRHYFAHTDAGNIPDKRKKYILDAKSLSLTFACRKDFALGIVNYRDIIYTEEQINILARFAKVFEQSYTRFLDLQKAEAQAREAQIEAALERVRSHAMAMQTSEELNALIGTVFTELTKLDLVLTRCVILIYEGNEKGVRWWMANSEAPSMPMNFFVRYADLPFFNEYLKGWQERSLKWQYILEGENKFNTDEFLFKETELSQLPDFVIAGMRAPDRVYLNASFNNFGDLTLASLEPLSEEHFNILLRFAKVFDLTYTRFNDLKQAEAQVRESHIQLALERVRARTMAMHKSVELAETAQVLFHQLLELGGIPDRIAIGVVDESAGVVNFWSTDQSGSHIDKSFKARLNERTVMSKTYQAWKDQKKSLVIDLHGDDVKEWIQFAREEMGVFVKDQFIKDRRVHNFGFFSHGWILVTTHEPQSDETIQILERFGSVFSLTYRRFLDLQRAEAQAREAQIEAALERVRARSMAMHHSSELHAVADVLFQQLRVFGGNIMNAGIALCTEDADEDEYWLSSDDGLRPVISIPHTEDPIQKKLYEDWKNKSEFFSIAKEGDELRAHYNYLRSVPHLKPFFEEGPGWSYPTWQKWHAACFSHGYLFMITLEPYEEEKILVRFAKVFEQAYTRFLDLQKAEAQAREAQVEAALEKIRGKAMAMHNSTDLSVTASLVFTELRKLGINPIRCGVGLFNKESQKSQLYSATSSPDGDSLSLVGWVIMTEHPVLEKIYESWLNNEEYYPELQGEQLRSYYQLLLRGLPVAMPDINAGKKQYGHFLPFSIGCLNTWSDHPHNESEIKILRRFATIIDLTFRRYLELQKSEANAREAQIETSLERVRSKTMAMHNSNDVGETVATMFAEFVHLGIHTNRCGILIFNDQYTAEVWTARSTPGGNAKLIIGKLDLDAHKMLRSVYNAWKAKETFYQYDLLDDDLVQYYTAINNSKFYPTQFDLNALPSKEFHSDFFFADGAVFSFTNEPVVEDNAKIIKRFALVFGQTYRRYLDLKKAEAQAREAQIELALERVRAKAMAMQRSDELNELVGTVSTELGKLDIVLDRCFILIYDTNTLGMTWWMSNPEASTESIGLFVKYHEQPPYLAFIKAWRERIVKWQYILEGETKKTWDKFLFAETELSRLPDFVIANMRANERVYLSASFNNFGCLTLATLDPLPDEQFDIMLRFAKVFDLTYTRFNDLKQAEAQAREAQIEAGLERVRSRTMAMFKSNELAETAVVMFKQLITLGIAPNRLYIAIINDTSGDLEFWITDENGDKMSSRYLVNVNKNISIKKMYKGWAEKKKAITINMEGEELEAWLTYWREEFHVPFKPGAALTRRVQNIAYFSKGFIAIASADDQPETTINLLERFAAVFNLTYTRFSDLQQAEAQAREAQIEAGLERVRAKTMAMHSSEDVSVATATMFTELERLGIENFRGGITNIFPDRTQDVWSVTNLAEGKVLKAVGAFNMDAHPAWQYMFKAWEAKEDFTHYFLAGEDKEEYIKILNATQGYLSQPIHQFPDAHFQIYYFKEGGVWTNSLHPHSEEDKQVMKRFTSVFSLTFRRYQDLKKAEAQAREATIEAALEKVRGKAMAMHNSNDLSVTASMVFTELRKLGISPIRCGVGLLNKESRKAPLYSATPSADGDSLSLVGWAILSGHPVLEKIYESWMENEEYYPELQGEQMRSYYQLLLKGLPVAAPQVEDDKKQYGHFLPFSVGCLYAWSEIPYNDTEIKILKRFATIIDLTFRRYIELQTSEANAREAVKQAALDRVRAEIASMRTVADLDRITPLIWNELTILGLPFIRCGIFLMDDSQQLIHTFLSTPDGKAIGAFHLPYDTPGNFSVMLKHWLDKKTYISRWEEVDFIGIAEILLQQGSIASKEQYLGSLPKGGFYLHFLPFLQGMLYVGNTTQLGEEEIELIQHVADAFSTAYARYEDFNRLEAAKQQVEKTLTDLKQAQTQLVQSEKMASLGELTAGIAHEIQNPLNFVNNFSDVSNELLDEMKEELAKGNIGDAIAIAEDVKQNLEKINHHGKRADGIVKGMLQHSRTSSSQKEMTDINVLVDEYLRLAYHGLRAKDKSFNAKFETDFDSSVGKINIIPQEFGRVILNLINNAFYAVTEKRKQDMPGYDPTVMATTKRVNGRIEVAVRDNGNGIPQKILDKIFQPFFTTKPTGQGTGLGLSLAYDIVKAHGGEIRVETKEGEGSTFIVQLLIV